MALRIFLLAALVACAAAQSCTGSARYRLTVVNTWTPERFSNVPANAHLSPLTAFSHSRRFSSFVLYGYATRGVQDVAETGDNRLLKTELRVGQTDGFVRSIKDNSNIPGPGERFSVSLNVDCEKHFVSFLTMIAPSPDWFVGASGVSVLEGGNFVDRKAGQLRVYDAGTDSGTMLTSRNMRTNPVENIAPLEGAPFMGRSAARYILRRVDV